MSIRFNWVLLAIALVVIVACKSVPPAVTEHLDPTRLNFYEIAQRTDTSGKTCELYQGAATTRAAVAVRLTPVAEGLLIGEGDTPTTELVCIPYKEKDAGGAETEKLCCWRALKPGAKR